MNMDRRAWLSGAGALLAGSSGGWAQTTPPYPGSRPIRIIVPLAAASAVDIMARKVGEQLSQRLGQSVIVENKPGAGGVIGTAELVRAPKDGHTLGVVASTHVISPGFVKSMPFDPLADITPITVIGTVALAIVAHPSFPANTVAELIAMAKAKPGSVDYGSAGTGSVTHLAGVMFEREAGVELKHVPYRGTGPLSTDLVAGHVKLAVLAVPAILPFVEAGQMKVLAVTTAARDAQLPNVPTLAESGLPGFDFGSWVALIGPKDLPAPIVDRLYREMKAIAETEKMKAEFVAQATTPLLLDPAASRAFFASELEKHQRLVVASGAKPE